MPAIIAITPEIVPEELLPAMNAVRPLSNNLMGNMIGPAVGGVIAAVSTTWAIGVDCATFLFGAACLLHASDAGAAAHARQVDALRERRRACATSERRGGFGPTLFAVAMSPTRIVFTAWFVLIPFFLLHTLHTAN